MKLVVGGSVINGAYPFSFGIIQKCPSFRLIGDLHSISDVRSLRIQSVLMAGQEGVVGPFCGGDQNCVADMSH